MVGGGALKVGGASLPFHRNSTGSSVEEEGCGGHCVGHTFVWNCLSTVDIVRMLLVIQGMF